MPSIDRFDRRCIGQATLLSRRAAALRVLGSAVVGLSGLALLSACSEPPAPPLAVGVNTWVGFDPLVLARDNHLIDSGQVKVVELATSSETLRHFRNGLLDAAGLTLDEALRLADEDIDIRVVAVLDASNGADVVLADPAIRDLSQLRGRRIAVERSTVGSLMLERLLQAAGLRPDEVTVLNIEVTQHLPALRSGRFDAVVSYEPLAGALRAAGYRTIFDSSRMPGEIVDVLVVRARLLEQRASQVEALMEAWRQGLAALNRDPGAAAAVLAPGVDLTPDAYRAVLERLSFYDPEQSLALLSGPTSAMERDGNRLAETLMRLGLIRRMPDWKHLIAPEPAMRVSQRGGDA